MFWLNAKQTDGGVSERKNACKSENTKVSLYEKEDPYNETGT